MNSLTEIEARGAADDDLPAIMKSPNEPNWSWPSTRWRGDPVEGSNSHRQEQAKSWLS